ncbi:MAG: C69 family dipeptidase, partial [Burkholderiales bacterium]|nr:C69 family dipeptidase [Burkholderiales bacterium]
YTTVPNWMTQLHGAVGFNEAGVGITGTESIYARDELLAKDPYNEETGITEDDILDILLPRAKTAKEAVELLGKIIEEKGAGEGFGVGFVDGKDVWYLETGTGHQWLAQRTPADAYFATGNQGRLRFFEPGDKDTLHSPTLISWAQENGFYDPKDGKFDFAKVYTRHDDRDLDYNIPRVWQIQKILNPSLEQKIEDGRNFDVYLKPEQPITLQNLKDILRNHYNESEHDPYSHGLNGKEPWRPISVFRTYESHVMQVRPNLPPEIGNVIYLAMGMADLSTYMPFYWGFEEIPVQYTEGTDKADSNSAYWKFRKLQTLAMQDYETYAPIVKKAFAEHEAKVTEEQAAFEKQYLELAKTNKAEANQLLQKFNREVIENTESLVEQLTDQIFTMMTAKVEKENFFANRKKKD